MLSMRNAVSLFVALTLAAGIGVAAEPQLASKTQRAALEVRATAQTGVEAFTDAVAEWRLGLGTDLRLDLGSNASAGPDLSSRTGGEGAAAATVEAGADVIQRVHLVGLGLDGLELGIGGDLSAEGSTRLGADAH